MRAFPSGDSLANVSIATTEVWNEKSTGERKEHTEFHRVTFFGGLAGIVGKYLSKGSLVYVEGSIKTRKYTDKDGVERLSFDIKAIGHEDARQEGRKRAIPGLQPRAKGKVPDRPQRPWWWR